MHLLHDERGLIVSWLVKITLVLGLLGLILYDGTKIGVNHFGLDEDAREIALEISDEVDKTSRFNQAPLIKQAEAMAKEADAKLVSLEIDEENTVHVKLRRRAETLIVSRIGPIEDWARAEAEGRARTN
jgi:hypothetical protein